MKRTRMERPQVVVEGPVDLSVRRLRQFVDWALKHAGLHPLKVKSFKHTAAREMIHGKTERTRLEGNRKPGRPRKVRK